MTSLIDIYEAAGATVNDDRTMVTMGGREEPLKPFEIVLRVFPHTVEMGPNGQETVTFAVLLDDTHFIHNSGRLEIFSYDEMVTLPVEQVHIHNPEEKRA